MRCSCDHSSFSLRPFQNWFLDTFPRRSLLADMLWVSLGYVIECHCCRCRLTLAWVSTKQRAYFKDLLRPLWTHTDDDNKAARWEQQSGRNSSTSSTDYRACLWNQNKRATPLKVLGCGPKMGHQWTTELIMRSTQLTEPAFFGGQWMLEHDWTWWKWLKYDETWLRPSTRKPASPEAGQQPKNSL